MLLDLMINHISRQSPEFQDFERRGRRSPHADLFITVDKVWPDGDPPRADIDLIFLRKPDSPFSTVTIRETGEQERVWTSFGSADWSEQVDLDVTSRATRALITDWLRSFAVTRRPDRPARRGRLRHQEARHELLHGRARDLRVPRLGDRRGRVVRADGPARGPRHATPPTDGCRSTACGPTTSCFPGWSSTPSRPATRERLADHLAGMPDRVFTTLDCHDGIPIRPDLDGILSASRDARPGVVGRAARRQRQPHPVADARRRGRRPPAQLHLLLRARLRRRPVPRRAGHPAVRPRRPAGLLRRAAGRRERPRRRRADRRRPGDQPPRLHVGRDRRGTRPPGRPAAARADPAAQQPPGLRRHARGRTRGRQPTSACPGGRRRRRARSRSTCRVGGSRSTRACRGAPSRPVSDDHPEDRRSPTSLPRRRSGRCGPRNYRRAGGSRRSP